MYNTRTYALFLTIWNWDNTNKLYIFSFRRLNCVKNCKNMNYLSLLPAKRVRHLMIKRNNYWKDASGIDKRNVKHLSYTWLNMIFQLHMVDQSQTVRLLRSLITLLDPYLKRWKYNAVGLVCLSGCVCKHIIKKSIFSKGLIKFFTTEELLQSKYM